MKMDPFSKALFVSFQEVIFLLIEIPDGHPGPAKFTEVWYDFFPKKHTNQTPISPQEVKMDV